MVTSPLVTNSSGIYNSISTSCHLRFINLVALRESAKENFKFALYLEKINLSPDAERSILMTSPNPI